MALITCQNCGKEISDKASKCVHCGFTIKKDKFQVEIKEKNNNLITKYLKSTIFTIVFIFLIYMFGSIKTSNCGNYSVIKLLEWIIVNELDFSHNFWFIIQIFIWLYLIICLFLTNHSKKTNTIAKVGYILMLLMEIIFALIISLTSRWNINIIYGFIVLYTFVYIVFLYVDGHGKGNNDISKEDSINNLDELKKLKELLDIEAITLEEYDEMKKVILDREIKKWL